MKFNVKFIHELRIINFLNLKIKKKITLKHMTARCEIFFAVFLSWIAIKPVNFDKL